MKRVIAGLTVGVAATVVLMMWSPMLSIRWPWQNLPEFGEVAVSLELPTEARIVDVEPIALDCRARVHAEVPIEARREHSLFGQVYRSDRIEMNAVGDVDTCVEGSSAQVIHRRDGSTEIVIPGESIVFVRPRVDTVATADSVEVTKGFAGKITDVFPWVSDNLGLTPLAYAYAQNVIGSSDCMTAAYTVTERMLIDAYRAQFIDQGADPDSLTVRIDGRPDFGDPAPIDMGDDVEMATGEEAVSCRLSDELGGGDLPTNR